MGIEVLQKNEFPNTGIVGDVSIEVKERITLKLPIK
jgi:hypothetical protein